MTQICFLLGGSPCFSADTEKKKVAEEFSFPAEHRVIKHDAAATEDGAPGCEHTIRVPKRKEMSCSSACWDTKDKR